MRAALLLALCLVSCGGKQGHGLPAAQGGAGGDPNDMTGEAGAGPETGGASGASAVSPGGADSDAMDAAGQTSVSLGGAGGAGEQAPGSASDGSGTELCEDQRDCSAGLECTALLMARQHTCLAHCAVAADCNARQFCLVGPGLAGACVPRCEWPWDCTFAFDCILPAGNSSYVCIPATWSGYFAAP